MDAVTGEQEWGQDIQHTVATKDSSGAAFRIPDRRQFALAFLFFNTDRRR